MFVFHCLLRVVALCAALQGFCSIHDLGKSMTVATTGQVIRVEQPAANETHGGFAVLGAGFGIVYVASKAN